MKLYKIEYTNREGVNGVEWVGTQADAKRKHKELVAEHERWNVEPPVSVEIPTSKPQLIAWLNEYVK